MRLNKSEREEFRKRVNILIQQMEKSEIVNHFQKEGYPRRTIFNTINRMQLGGKIKDKKKFPGHLPERISSKDWPITAKESTTSWS